MFLALEYEKLIQTDIDPKIFMANISVNCRYFAHSWEIADLKYRRLTDSKCYLGGPYTDIVVEKHNTFEKRTFCILHPKYGIGTIFPAISEILDRAGCPSTAWDMKSINTYL